VCSWTAASLDHELNPKVEDHFASEGSEHRLGSSSRSKRVVVA
jgi:hypothetical protein